MILTDDIVKDCGYILWRPINNGLDGIGILKMYGANYRLQLFDYNGPQSNYCYHSKATAIEAFLAWRPELEADPIGWVKHIESDRCRPGGDPSKESIGWPLPEVLRS
jgi:hypothetical protein